MELLLADLLLLWLLLGDLLGEIRAPVFLQKLGNGLLQASPTSFNSLYREAPLLSGVLKTLNGGL